MYGVDNSANRTSEEDSMSDDERMFLYARVVHSNHSIQYHMHQIMKRQRVIDEYRNMTMEGMDVILLESNLHQYHSVIISQIINMFESDNFWHRKTFESVMSNLRNMWLEGIQELENARMHCTDDDENNNEMDRIEVIDLCSVSWCRTDMISEGKESAMQESLDCGDLIGKANQNPILDILSYQVQFPDGEIASYAANLIAENMITQCDPDGNQFLLLESITDHKKDMSAAP